MSCKFRTQVFFHYNVVLFKFDPSHLYRFISYHFHLLAHLIHIQTYPLWFKSVTLFFFFHWLSPSLSWHFLCPQSFLVQISSTHSSRFYVNVSSSLSLFHPIEIVLYSCNVSEHMVHTQITVPIPFYYTYSFVYSKGTMTFKEQNTCLTFSFTIQ